MLFWPQREQERNLCYCLTHLVHLYMTNIQFIQYMTQTFLITWILVDWGFVLCSAFTLCTLPVRVSASYWNRAKEWCVDHSGRSNFSFEFQTVFYFPCHSPLTPRPPLCSCLGPSGGPSCCSSLARFYLRPCISLPTFPSHRQHWCVETHKQLIVADSQGWSCVFWFSTIKINCKVLSLCEL